MTQASHQIGQKVNFFRGTSFGAANTAGGVMRVISLSPSLTSVFATFC